MLQPWTVELNHQLCSHTFKTDHLAESSQPRASGRAPAILAAARGAGDAYSVCKRGERGVSINGGNEKSIWRAQIIAAARFAASSSPPVFSLCAELFETLGNSCLPLIDPPLPGSLCGKHIDPWLLLVPLITDGLCHCQALI